MSSDEDYDLDFGAGIEEDCQNTFHRSKEEAYYHSVDFDDDEEGKTIDPSVHEFHVPKYDKDVNKKVKEIVVNEGGDSNDGALDDFMELLGDTASAESETTKNVEEIKPTAKETEKPAMVKKPSIDDEDGVLTDKSSGIRIIKSPFSSDAELNMRLNSDYGQYFRLTDISVRQDYIQTNKMDWYTVAVIGSKSETKCSAKGNNYVIWNIYDLNNLEREQEISLFLFGNSYKSFWKSSEFEVFAISKADFFDDSKSTASAAPTKFGQKPKQPTAAKKFSISVRNDNQLIPLGTAKDISACQSYKKTQVGNNERNTEGSQRCKNLVNLRLSKYCVYHCKKLDKNFKATEKYGSGGSGYSNKSKFQAGKSQIPTGKSRVAEAIINEGGIHIYNPKINIKNIPVKPQSKYQMAVKSTQNTPEVKSFEEKPFSNSAIEITNLKKDLKQKMKEETLLSLTYNQHDSPIVSKMTFKSTKASDKELMAKLLNKDIDENELKSIRKAALTENPHDGQKKANKGLSTLFSSKTLLPNETNCNNSVSAKKLVELKNSNALLTNLQKSHEEQKNYNLSTMGSHRDIVKELKKSAPNEELESDEVQKKPERATPTLVARQTVKAFDFLKQRVQDISNEKKPVIPKPPVVANKIDFDLELFIGDEKTTKKLMDFSSPSQTTRVLTPKFSSPNVTETRKRKIDEINSPTSTIDSEKEKKRKMIDDLINIKSKYSKDANDPEKNAHLKSYLDRLEEKESVENRLSAIKRKEVRVVTCKICNYTSFSQSDLCKSKRHEVTRPMVIQRYFKCKNCSKRTYTLDKVYPVSSCMQCGCEKFEPCGMKNEVIEKTFIDKSILPD